MHDELTGLANRTYLHEYLTGCFEHAYAEEKLLGVELMDIDFFKEYNDHYGHLMGDRCLKAIAGVLQKIQTPGQVFCARYGRDDSGADPENFRGHSQRGPYVKNTS